VVVAVGETDFEVPVTVPTPWSIVSEVAPVTLQLSVELCPEVILAGFALKELITGWLGGGRGATFTVTVAVVVPALFCAVSV
jgi:hypothetical protein